MPIKRSRSAYRRRSKRKSVRFATGKRRKRTIRRTRTSTVVIKNPNLPFPRKVMCKLRASCEGTITTATSMPVTYQHHCNVPISPFNVGTAFGAINFPNAYENLAGTYPVGMNQYLTHGFGLTGPQGIYQNYKVNAIASELQLSPEFAYGGTGSQSMQVFDLISVPLKNYFNISEIGLTGASNIQSTDIASMPYAKTSLVPATRVTKHRRFISIRKLYGLSKEQWRNQDAVLNNDNALGLYGSFSGGRNAFPTNEVFMQYMIRPGNSSQTQNNWPISYKCKITMYVEFFNPVVNQYPYPNP